METAWRRAAIEVGLRAKPFSAISGPAGATLASALRIGWSMPGPFCFRISDGTLLQLDSECPWVVKQFALDDLMRLEAAASSLAAQVGGPPDLRPLKQFLRSKACKGSPAAAGSLRALGEGGWWTQDRRFNEGLPGVVDPYCRACGPEAPPKHRAPETLPQPVGSLHHRVCACRATQELRDSYKHQDVLSRAQSALHGSDALYQVGVPLLEPRPKVPELEVYWCGGRAPPNDFTFTGHGFTDGAMRGGGPPTAKRAGWAAVLVNEAGLVIAGIYGPCPDAFPTSLRAELQAVIQMLKLALPPLTIWVDNKGVVDGWVKGKTWCCSSSRPAADLWAQFWHLVDDIGTEHLRIEKCKGHATAGDVAAGRASEFTRVANDNADHFAGRGVDCAEHQSPSSAEKARYTEAKRWYQWLMVLCANWPADTQPLDAEVECSLPGLPVVEPMEKACRQAHARANRRMHQLVACNEGKYIRCQMCHERRPASDATYWQEKPCWLDQGSRSEANMANAQEELEEELQVVGTIAQIQATRRKRTAETVARRKCSRRNKAAGESLWIR